MAKIRHLIRMNDDEAWAYTGGQRDMHVAILNHDGTPQLTTNWFAVVDGQVVFNSYESSQRIVNLRHHQLGSHEAQARPERPLMKSWC